MNSVMYFGTLYNSLRMLVGAFSVLFLLSRGLTIIDVGLIKTLQAIVIFSLDLPLSYFSDRYSRRFSILLGVICSVGWLFITGLAINKSFFYFAEIMNALSIVFFNSAYGAYLIDSAKSEGVINIQLITARAYKLQFLAMGISAFIGSFFTSISSSLVWYISAILLSILWMLGFFLLPKDKDLINIKANSLKSDIKTLSSLLLQANPKLKLIVVNFILLSVFYQILIQFWQPLSQNLLNNALKNNDSAHMYGIIFIFILMAQSLAGLLTEKIKEPHKTVNFAVIFSLFSLFTLGVALFYIPWMIAVSIVFLFFSNRTSCISMQSIILSETPSDLRATVIAASSTAVRILLFIIIPGFSFAIATIGWQIIFYICLIIFIFTLPRKFFSNQKKPSKIRYSE